ncbi:hypothetical protein NADFUDRAFT_4925, partial [Nadsonia fulvescens var. elongata DSM 6958]
RLATPEYFYTHWNRNDLKPLLRSWLSMWISLVLITVPPTEVYIGQSTYLMAIICCIIPCGTLSLIQNVMISIYLMASTCFSWAIMIITFKISADVRGNMTRTEAVRQVMEAGLCSPSLSPAELAVCFQKAVFTGFFIDKKSSIITAFGMLASYVILGYIRKTNPPHKPAALIGIIFTTIAGTYGNFFPYFDGTSIPLFIVKPLGLVLCLNIFLSCVIYPKTLNSSYIANLSQEFSIIQKITLFHTDFIKTVRPTQDEWDSRENIREMISSARKMFPRLDMEAGMLKKELAYTRLSADTCVSLGHSVKTLLNALTGLPFMYDNINDYKSIILEDNQADMHLKRRKSSIHQVAVTREAEKKMYEPVGKYDQYYSMTEILKKEKQKLRYKNHPDNEEISTPDLKDLDELLEITANSTIDVNDCCNEAVEIMYEWLVEANKFKVYTLVIPGLRSERKHHQKELALKIANIKKKLSLVVNEYKSSKRLEMYQDFDIGTYSGLSEVLTTSQLRMNYILQGNLYGFYLMEYARGIEGALKIMNDTDINLPKPKLFHPLTSNYKVLKSKTEGRFSQENEGNNEYFNENNPEIIPGMNKKQSHNRDPDSLPPSKWYHSIGAGLYWIYHSVVLNDDVLFSLKAGVFTVLMAFPAFFKESAGFFYKYRLGWVVIITNMGISEYVGTSIYSLVVKILYTFIACILGMLAWYISAGSGNGNYYGFSAVCLVSSFFVVYYRNFSVHSTPIPSIITTVTFVLVIALSWVGNTYPNISSLEAGWEVAWIRFASTIAGVLVGTFASFFPKPTTGKKTIRMTLSRTVRETGNLHCDVREFAVHRIKFPLIQVDFRDDVTSKNMTALFKKLIMTGSLMQLMIYEPPLTGAWPAAEYKKLVNTQTEIFELYRHLYSLFKRFEDPEFWIAKCLDQFGWKDSVFMADFFAVIYMSSGALATGNPLPQITPTNLLAKHLYKFGALTLPFENNHHHRHLNYQFSQQPPYRNSVGDDGIPIRSIESRMSHNKMDLELLKSYDGGLYITGIILINSIYERIDRLLLCVKELVGEEFENDTYYFEDDQN